MTSVEVMLDIGYLVSGMGERQPLTRLSTESATGNASASSRHVLVVDDEPAILEIFREVLVDEACRVTALRALPSTQDVVRSAPDAIVLDLVFGGHNCGLELLHALRAHPGTAAIPVVVCTAVTDPGIAAALAELGVTVLTKPFDLDDAIAVIRSALNPNVAGFPA